MMTVIEFKSTFNRNLRSIICNVEAIGIIPQAKESSVFQVIYNLTQKAAGKK